MIADGVKYKHSVRLFSSRQSYPCRLEFSIVSKYFDGEELPGNFTIGKQPFFVFDDFVGHTNLQTSEILFPKIISDPSFGLLSFLQGL